jgi:two-component system sensor histidine kinase UhpB
MSLFWRVFLANAAILLAGLLALVVAPVGIDANPSAHQLATLVAGVAVMVVVDWFILRPFFRPLEQLVRRMDTADVLAGGQRVPVTGPREVGQLETAFNTMMERLEDERRAAGGRALSALERERQRIAANLHDEVGQTMTGILFLLKRLEDDVPPRQRPAFAEAQQAVRASLEDVRRMAQELRPESLDHLGLTAALANLARRFSDRTGIPVRRELQSGLPSLDPDVEVVLYRVAQEALTNAARHSGASEVVLALGRVDDRIVFRVFDDGHGMNGRPEGGGLRGIRERALIIGAAVAIQRAPTGGVEIRLEVPAA